MFFKNFFFDENFIKENERKNDIPFIKHNEVNIDTY